MSLIRRGFQAELSREAVRGLVSGFVWYAWVAVADVRPLQATRDRAATGAVDRLWRVAGVAGAGNGVLWGRSCFGRQMPQQAANRA